MSLESHSKLELSKTFTKGGQVSLHNFRMIRQVMTVTILITVLGGALFWGIKTWTDFTPYDRYLIRSAYVADMKLLMTFGKATTTQTFRDPMGRVLTVNSHSIQKSPAARRLKQTFYEKSLSNVWLSLGVMAGLFTLICGFWVWRGRVKKAKEILSGTQLVEPEKLQNLLEDQNIDSPFTLGGVSLRLDSETQHLLFVGTTGTGKSTCFKHLLPQIQEAGQRAVIVDTTGEFISRFYREGKDILLNPFDERSRSWNPWMDCIHPYHFDELSNAFIPQTSHDRFWAESARMILSETLQKLHQDGKPDLERLLGLLLEVPLSELHAFLKDTSAGSLTDPAGDKTAMSIRSHLAPYLKSLKHMPQDRELFSLRKWMGQEGGDDWLFIGSLPDQRETLRPLITGFMTIAMNSLMSLTPDPTRRMWFMIDELASLQKQETLPKALAETRKYGGCIAAGLQSIPQLQEIYGYAESKSLTSLFNTKAIFRSGDPESAKQLSLMLGEQEVKESNEGISYGAHQMRDGVSLNEQKRLKPVVSANEIMRLNDLEAYLRLSGDLPITKVKFSYPTQDVVKAA